MTESALNMLAPVRTLDRAITGIVRGVLAPPHYLSNELARFQKVRAKTLDMLGTVTPEQAQ